VSKNGTKKKQSRRSYNPAMEDRGDEGSATMRGLGREGDPSCDFTQLRPSKSIGCDVFDIMQSIEGEKGALRNSEGRLV
jgi:hypothetical protein